MPDAYSESEVAAFQREIGEFNTKSETDIGEIVRSHLIVEFYLNKCLDACYPEPRHNESARLSFHQKVYLLPGWCFGFAWIRDGVIHLNRIRNKAAHNISYTLTDTDLKQLLKAVEPVAHLMGKRDLSGVAIVREISLQASMALCAWANKITAASKYGVGGYLLLEDQKRELHREGSPKGTE